MTKRLRRLLLATAAVVTACAGAAYTASNTVEPTNAGITALGAVKPALALGKNLCTNEGPSSEAQSPTAVLTPTSSTISPKLLKLLGACWPAVPSSPGRG